MFEIVQYIPKYEAVWNDFVVQSKNGTFLFDRRYMDYHADRFRDHSLLFFLKGRLYAVLPMNEVGSVAYSHQGLTYGGLVMDARATTANVVTLFRELNGYLRSQGMNRMVYKPTPWIYHTLPAEEDLYAIVEACQARLQAREVSTTLFANNRVKWSMLRSRCLKRAWKENLKFAESSDFATFWSILTDNLQRRYGLNPVHTLEEILLLRERFPENIRLFAAYKDSRMLGGMVFYMSQQVIHSQYIAASEEGKQYGALDYIMWNMKDKGYYRKPYFDFGKSTEEQGDVLNEGLIHQKEGFGGRAVCYDTYAWEV